MTLKPVLLLFALLCAFSLHAAGPYPGNDADHGVSRAAGTLDAYTGNLSFQTQDLDVPGAVGLHGLSFGRIANSRLTRLESHFGLGHNWSHNWQWELTDAGLDSEGRRVLSFRRPEGLIQRFTEVAPGDWWPEAAARERLEWSSDSVTIHFPKGGQVRFAATPDGVYQLERLVDDFGLEWSFTWEAGRLSRITEPAGRWLAIHYTETVFDRTRSYTVIDAVEASNGMRVDYHYDFPAQADYPVLFGVDYPGGITAHYVYEQPVEGRRHLLVEAMDPRAMANIRGRRLEYRSDEVDALGQVARVLEAETGRVIDEVFQGSDPRAYEARSSDGNRVYQSYLPGGGLEEVVDALGNTTSFSYDADGRGYRTAATDALGQTLYYERDVHGNVAREIYVDGSSRSWTHDARGRVLSESDELGHTRLYERDENGRLIAVLHPDGSRDWTRYNAWGQVVEQSRSGVIRSSEFDESGQMIRTTNALGHQTHYDYEARGFLSAVTDPLGNRTKFEHDEAGQLTAVIYPDGTRETKQYDAWGQVVASTDSSGVVTRFEYDAFGRRTGVVDQQGHATRIEYGPIGEVTGHLPVRQIRPSGEVTVFHYDARGHLIEQTLAPGTGESATTRFTYDPVGRRIASTDAKGNVTLLFYNERGRLIQTVDPLGNATQYAYDPAGRKVSETDAKGNTTHFSYDTMGRRILSMDALGFITRYLHDANGRLTGLIDPKGQMHRFEYDALGQRTGMVYPDGSHERWVYDANGNNIEYRNRAGQAYFREFDARDRLTTSQWDNGEGLTVRSYDALGRLASVRVPGVSEHRYQYDELGRLSREVQRLEGLAEPKVLDYHYDASHRRSALVYPDGTTVAYHFNERGQLAAIDALGVDALVAYSYDSNGRATRRPYANGLSTETAYNEVGHLTDLRIGDLQQLSYQYDEVGNRTAEIEADGRALVYDYDAVHQLTLVQQQDAFEQVLGETVYNYDPAGNRTEVVSDEGSTRYLSNVLNQYIEIASGHLREEPQWDANGNLVRWNGLVLSYDALNRLEWVQGPGVQAEFAYDYRNRCVRRTINGKTTYLIYDDWKLIAEYDANGQAKAQYIHGRRIDEIVATVNVHGTFFHHHDGLGNVTHLTDIDGQLVESYTYDAYGSVHFWNSESELLESSAIGNRFLFTGREYLVELDLYDYRNRTYAPALGRFVQNDPIRFEAGDLNLYRYVFNNPLRWTDPTGLIANSTFEQNYINGSINYNAFSDWHYSRNAENDAHFREQGLYGRDDIRLNELTDYRQASSRESIYHRIGEGNENNLKFTSNEADGYWNRYGRYEIVVRPNDYDNSFTHVRDETNMGTLNRGSNIITHFLLDVLPYWLFGNE